MEDLKKAVEANSQTIFIKEKGCFKRIRFNEILFIESSGSYCFIYLLPETKILVSFSLNEIMKYLPPPHFLRVHRSYVINASCVESFIGNTLFIRKFRIPMSRQHKEETLSHFNILGNTK